MSNQVRGSGSFSARGQIVLLKSRFVGIVALLLWDRLHLHCAHRDYFCLMI